MYYDNYYDPSIQELEGERERRRRLVRKRQIKELKEENDRLEKGGRMGRKSRFAPWV